MLNKVRKINNERSSRLSSILLITDIAYLSILMSKLLQRTFNDETVLLQRSCRHQELIGLGRREAPLLAIAWKNRNACNGLPGKPDNIPPAKSGSI